MLINTVGELKKFIDKLDDDTKIRISEGMYQYPVKGSFRTTVVSSNPPSTITSVELEAYKDS